MTMRRPLKLLFYLNIFVVVYLIGYKAYLNFFRLDFDAVHAEQLVALEERLDGRTSYRFAVVGNINNSVGIFERQIIPQINASGIDFMVSAGNAVSGGGEDKYRALYGTLGKLDVPYLLTFGDQEYENFGSFRFYDHFGPHFYSVKIADSRFVFLDSTGKTPARWQIRWLREVLSQEDAAHTFVFIGDPLLRADEELLFAQADNYLERDDFRQALLDLIDVHDVDAVFSANLPLFSTQTRNGTDYVITGGAGGLILNTDTSFYHYVEVTVTPEGVAIEVMPLQSGQHLVFQWLESVWFFIYSLFYVGYVNFILLVSVLGIIAIRLYSLMFVDRDYYPDYDVDPAPWIDRPLRVAMFTNNYLPFIGGVPISVARLRAGLTSLGNEVLIVAPRYRSQSDIEDNVVRVPSLLAMGEKGEFRLANIFLARIRKRVRAFQPDVIHLHHPFWLGSLGMFVARRLNVPVIYTYHTRLEHYAHFVPLPGRLFRNFVSHALIRRFANKCDGVIVPTYSAEEYLRVIGVRRATFIQPTGIEYERFQRVSEAEIGRLRSQLGLRGEVVLVSVSRLSDEKNIDFMIDAVARLRARIKRPFRCLMIGEGAQRDQLQKRIDDLDLRQHFTLVGAVPPECMPAYYRLGDLFVFASKSETQGMVILEAMAAGMPVVAIRSSGIDDVVRDGHNGFKTPENQNQWQAAVERLVVDDEFRQTLGRNALAFAKDYSVEAFARDVKRIYAQVLASAAKENSRD